MKCFQCVTMGHSSCFYYKDDELLVVASERPVIQTTLDVEADEVHELKPGQGIFMNKNGEMHTEQVLDAKIMQLARLNVFILAVALTLIYIVSVRS